MASNNNKITLRAKRVSSAVSAGVKKALKAFEKEIPEQIRKRTRLGGGVEVRDKKTGLGGRRTTLEKLATSTKEYRSFYARSLHPQTSPSKSNLTATGQLLDSLEGRKRPGDIIKVSAEGRRLRDLDGSSSVLSNKQVQEYVERAGRGFLGLTDDEVKKFRSEARNIIQAEI